MAVHSPTSKDLQTLLKGAIHSLKTSCTLAKENLLFSKNPSEILLFLQKYLLNPFVFIKNLLHLHEEQIAPRFALLKILEYSAEIFENRRIFCSPAGLTFLESEAES